MNLDHQSTKGIALLRIMSGLLLLEHGTKKLLSFTGGERAGSELAFDSPAAFAGVIELVCGLLITIGLFTRPAAFLASGTMAAAYFMAHAPHNFFPFNNGGDAATVRGTSRTVIPIPSCGWRPGRRSTPLHGASTTT